MAAKADPVIREAAAQVMELNEDEAERMLAYKRWRWEMEQAAREEGRYESGLAEGEKRADAKYQPVIEENRAIIEENRAIIEKNQAIIEEKDREIEELRRKLQEIEGR